jgi:hypothetical protein
MDDTKHFLTLTDANGVLLDEWCVEDDIGDLNKPFARIHLCEAILREISADNEWKKHRRPK